MVIPPLLMDTTIHTRTSQLRRLLRTITPQLRRAMPMLRNSFPRKRNSPGCRCSGILSSLRVVEDFYRIANPGSCSPGTGQVVCSYHCIYFLRNNSVLGRTLSTLSSTVSTTHILCPGSIMSIRSLGPSTGEQEVATIIRRWGAPRPHKHI